MPIAPVNRRILLHSRPRGAPTVNDFSLVEAPVPEPKAGQILLRTQFLSLDPYMRGRMNAGKSYAAPVELGEVMVGGTVAKVEISHHPDYRAGDLVVSYHGWQDYALSDGKGLSRISPEVPEPSWFLGVLGMPGLTAYMGLLDIGQPQPGETVVVAAATGAVGSVVGQIAKLKGCRVVAIAGGPTKCDYALGSLGFDVCLDHHAPDLPGRLRESCPAGIDIYFENVGGAVFEAVLPLLNSRARIPLCGLVSQYNAESLPTGPDRLPLLAMTLLAKRVRMQGFIINDDYGSRYGEFATAMGAWLHEGKIVTREDRVIGLENAPAAFIGLLSGRNFGKLIIAL